MEVVEPRTIWIMPMGYEVDAITLETYAQNLLSQLVDPKKERFGTFKEKDLSLHKQFIDVKRKRKIKKKMKVVVEKKGHTKEAIQRTRAQNILREEDVIKPQPQLVNPPMQPKAKTSKFAPISGVKKPVPLPKIKPIVSIDEVEKKKKEKPSRQYVGAEEEIESNEVQKVEKTPTYS